MKNKYDEIMDRVEVSDEMRTRILTNIQEQTAQNIPEKTSEKVVPFKSWKRYTSLAAAILIVLVGTFAMKNMMKTTQQTEPETPGNELMVTAPTEVSSLEELSKTVGFPVEELQNLPFEADEVIYTAYSDGAEVTWQKGEKQLTYSKKTEIGGNNGHFETYDLEETIQINGKKVTLKGDSTGYQIADWDDGSYGYMIYSSVSITKEQMTAMLE